MSEQAASNVPQGRKRSRNPTEWKRNAMKAKKDGGKAYTTHYSGKSVGAKQQGSSIPSIWNTLEPSNIRGGLKTRCDRIGPSCGCKQECYARIGDDHLARLFTAFYALESYGSSSRRKRYTIEII